MLRKAEISIDRNQASREFFNCFLRSSPGYPGRFSKNDKFLIYFHVITNYSRFYCIYKKSDTSSKKTCPLNIIYSIHKYFLNKNSQFWKTQTKNYYTPFSPSFLSYCKNVQNNNNFVHTILRIPSFQGYTLFKIRKNWKKKTIDIHYIFILTRLKKKPHNCTLY